MYGAIPGNNLKSTSQFIYVVKVSKGFDPEHERY